MRVLTFLLILAACFTLISENADETNESQAGVLNLLIEPGAKQAGMGEARTGSKFRPASAPSEIGA